MKNKNLVVFISRILLICPLVMFTQNLYGLSPEAKIILKNLRAKQKTNSDVDKVKTIEISSATVRNIFNKIKAKSTKIVIPVKKVILPKLKPKPKPAIVASTTAQTNTENIKDSPHILAEAYEHESLPDVNKSNSHSNVNNELQDHSEPIRWNKFFLIIIFANILIYILLLLESIILNDKFYVLDRKQLLAKSSKDSAANYFKFVYVVWKSSFSLVQITLPILFEILNVFVTLIDELLPIFMSFIALIIFIYFLKFALPFLAFIVIVDIMSGISSFKIKKGRRRRKY